MSRELIYGYYNASLPRPLCRDLFAETSLPRPLYQGPNRGMKKHQYNYCIPSCLLGVLHY